MNSVGVVYLARGDHALDDFQRFAESYRRHPAGLNHQLVVLLKGVHKRGARAAAIALFRQVGARIIEIDDYGYDLHAYLRATARLDHEYLLFFNTYTEVVTDDWLKKLHTHLIRPGVGLVGTTGSFESLNDSWKMLTKVKFLTEVAGARFDRAFAATFSHWLQHAAPAWYRPARSVTERWWRFFDDAIEERKRFDDPSFVAPSDRYWEAVTLEPPMQRFLDFQVFPNPHVRSNAFMIARRRLLALNFDLEPTKDACNVFENGPGNLTQRIRALGLATLLVGADGKAYDIPDWPTSRGFRLGRQDNLITSDNQVRNFAGFSAPTRRLHGWITWGEYVMPRPEELSFLNQSFAKDEASTTPSLRLAPAS